LSYPNVEEITLVIQLLDKNSSIYSFWRIIDYNLYTLISVAAPTLQLNGDTPIIHKSVVNTKNMSAVVSSPGTNSPHIRTSLSPRSVHAAKPASSQTMSGLRNPKSSLPAPTNHRTRYLL